MDFQRIFFISGEQAAVEAAAAAAEREGQAKQVQLPEETSAGANRSCGTIQGWMELHTNERSSVAGKMQPTSHCSACFASSFPEMATLATTTHYTTTDLR